MTLTEALNEQMKNESFKKEYEALAPEYAIISSLIDAREQIFNWVLMSHIIHLLQSP